MPGWWFTVELTTTKHMLQQFKSAIEEALTSNIQSGATMRARSAKQRFPVAKWVENLNTLQQNATKVHAEEKGALSFSAFGPRSRSRATNLYPSLQFPNESPFHPRSRDVSMDRLSARGPGLHEIYLDRVGRAVSCPRSRASLVPKVSKPLDEQQSFSGTPRIQAIDPEGTPMMSEDFPSDEKTVQVGSSGGGELHFSASQTQLAFTAQTSTVSSSGGRLTLIDTSYDSH